MACGPTDDSTRGNRRAPPAVLGRTIHVPGHHSHARRAIIMTSGHRWHTSPVPGRHDTDHRDRPDAVSADDRLARDLPALRAAVWTMPHSAVRLLQNLLRTRGPAETAHDVDLMILLAEAYLRCRHATAALQAADRAVHAAEALCPIDSRRRLCGYGVTADIALATGGPAVAVYRKYLHQLTAAGSRAGEALRTVYARAGLAVAVCREINREHGLQLLTDLCEWVQDEQGRHHAVTITIVAGLTALHDGCSTCGSRMPDRRSSPQAVPLAPLPGGILQPELTEPDRAFLVSRVHDCPQGPR
jgi:hypothetical protein